MKFQVEPWSSVVHWDAEPQMGPSVVIIVIIRESKPYSMYSVSQSLFSTLASNEFPQNFEFICATRLDSTRIVKNVTRVIGEHKFVIDCMLASLTPWLEAIEEKYHCR